MKERFEEEKKSKDIQNKIVRETHREVPVVARKKKLFYSSRAYQVQSMLVMELSRGFLLADSRVLSSSFICALVATWQSVIASDWMHRSINQSMSSQLLYRDLECGVCTEQMFASLLPDEPLYDDCG